MNLLHVIRFFVAIMFSLVFSHPLLILQPATYISAPHLFSFFLIVSDNHKNISALAFADNTTNLFSLCDANKTQKSISNLLIQSS